LSDIEGRKGEEGDERGVSPIQKKLRSIAALLKKRRKHHDFKGEEGGSPSTVKRAVPEKKNSQNDLRRLKGGEGEKGEKINMSVGLFSTLGGKGDDGEHGG